MAKLKNDNLIINIWKERFAEYDLSRGKAKYAFSIFLIYDNKPEEPICYKNLCKGSDAFENYFQKACTLQPKADAIKIVQYSDNKVNSPVIDENIIRLVDEAKKPAPKKQNKGISGFGDPEEMKQQIKKELQDGFELEHLKKEILEKDQTILELEQTIADQESVIAIFEEKVDIDEKQENIGRMFGLGFKGLLKIAPKLASYMNEKGLGSLVQAFTDNGSATEQPSGGSDAELNTSHPNDVHFNSIIEWCKSIPNQVDLEKVLVVLSNMADNFSNVDKCLVAVGYPDYKAYIQMQKEIESEKNNK
jgi:hypothetical protein